MNLQQSKHLLKDDQVDEITETNTRALNYKLLEMFQTSGSCQQVLALLQMLDILHEVPRKDFLNMEFLQI
ncbi:MAG: hypothetical protein ACJZ9L_05255 [Coraliomargaritaceae bacterium]